MDVWREGVAIRGFLYVEDAVDAARCDGSEPVNLGNAFEISIRDLVGLLANATRFQGRILWDRSKPNGQPRRKLDATWAERELGFRATTGFDDELRRTVAWYLERGPCAIGRAAGDPRR